MIRRFWQVRSTARTPIRTQRRRVEFESLESRELLATLFVATSGSDTGAGTAESPYRNIQKAVTAANSGDEIRVASGTYFYDSSADVFNSKRNLTYSGVLQTTAVVSTYGKQLSILGGFTTSDWAVSDPEAHPTIIDGQGQYRGVFVLGSTAATGLDLEGFTIRNGLATGIAGRGGADAVYAFGGGLFVDMGGRQADSSPFVFKNLVFQNNTARASGPLGSEGGRAAGGGLALRYVQNATMDHVTFQSNTAQGTDGAEAGGGGLGGAIQLDHSRLVGANLTFTGNRAISGNSAGSGRGGQTNEKADALGGAFAIQAGSSAVLSYVVATNNEARGGSAATTGGDAYGGAFFAEFAETSLTITDSFLQGNRAIGGNAASGGNAGGGAVMSQNSTIVIARSRIVANTVQGGNTTSGGSAGTAGGGGIYLARFNGAAVFALTSSVVADNSILAGQGSAASGGGGGLWVQGLAAAINSSTFDNNHLDDRLSQGQAIFLVGGGGSPSSATISNSIISRHTSARRDGGAVDIAGGTNGSVAFSRNLIFDNQALIGPLTTSGVTGGETNIVSGAANTIPSLYNAPGGPFWDYHLVKSAANPAIDAALASAAALDLDANPRLGAPDLGAAEAISPRFELVGPVRATEGTSAKIVISRRGDLSVGGSVELVVLPGGTAREGVDYSPIGNGGVIVVTFAPYEETKTILLSTLAQSGVQGDRTITLGLRLVGGDTANRIGSPATITATIVDNTVSSSVNGFAATEIKILRNGRGVKGVQVTFNAKFAPASLRKGIRKIFSLRKVSGSGRLPKIASVKYRKASGMAVVRFSKPIPVGLVVELVIKGKRLKDTSGRVLNDTSFLISA